MEINMITEFISTVGFPIAACVLMAWYFSKQDEKHDKEVGELRKAIDNNTLIITKLYERLTHGE